MKDELIYESNESKVFLSSGEDNQKVIIKVLKQEFPEQEKLLQFYNEFEVTHEAKIDGVRRAIDKKLVNNHHAIVLEYIDGQTLASQVSATISIERFLSVAMGLTQALNGLHQQYIIHKDINPRNVLTDGNDKVSVIDFGSSQKMNKSIVNWGKVDHLEGSLPYISPEQTGRMNRPLDYRTDFYSLGITLYELLTGELPFKSKDPLELVHAHLAKTVVSPCEIRNDIPVVLGNIILKLVEKNPDARYQSAYGLMTDLYKVMDGLKEGSVEEFELGKKDFSERFILPDKLYGRDSEVMQLMGSFERVNQGGFELLMITGKSGVGKSALIGEIQQPISAMNGYFLSGKYDQIHRSIPYSAIVQALTQFTELILADSDENLRIWKSKILDEIGTQGRILTDLIPGLIHIIGEQPEVPELGGLEALNRLNYVFRKFVKVISQQEHPVVMFLDDLQWVDAASLNMIRTMVSDQTNQYFLLIGTYRDDEVSETHQLNTLLNELDDANIHSDFIHLENLEVEDINEMIADCLHLDLGEIQEFGDLVIDKTKGNPIFIRQFLMSLHEKDLLTFDSDQHKWEWELDKIRNENITDNVVKLLSERVLQLPEGTQNTLKLAACVGNKFDLETLSIISKKSVLDLSNELCVVVEQGMIRNNEKAVNVGAGEAVKTNLDFEFVHDRIQQSIYELIDESEKENYHLQIGRLLVSSLTEEELEARVFDVIAHLNTGKALMSDKAELKGLGLLNLKAGKLAKKASAFELALEKMKIAVSLLEKGSWDADYKLLIELYSQAADCAFLSSDLKLMDQYADEVFSHGKNILDYVDLYNLKVNALISQMELPKALDVGLKALKELGVKFPNNPKVPHIIGGLMKTKKMLAGKSPEKLENLPLMTDPKLLQAMPILENVVPAAYMSGSHYFPLLVFKMVQLSVKHGNNDLSPFAYSSFGITLSGVLGDFNQGYEFGQLGLRLLEKLKVEKYRVKVAFVNNCFLRHWKDHNNTMPEPLLTAYHHGMEVGDITSGAWVAYYRLLWMFLTSSRLDQLEDEMDKFQNVFDDLKQDGALNMSWIQRQTIENLRGESEHPTVLKGSYYDEQEKAKYREDVNDKTSVFFFHMNKMMLHYMFKEYDKGMSHADLASKHLEAVVGLPYLPVYHMYDALLSLKTGKSGRASKNLKKLKKWGKSSEHNYRHKALLVEGALAAQKSNVNKAAKALNKAIKLADEHGYYQEEALGCEIAFELYDGLGQHIIAEAYLSKALAKYHLWGASKKVDQIREMRPHLAESNQGLSVDHTISATSSGSIGSSILDIGSVMKASTTISEEIALEKLLKNLLHVVLENAGAQEGAILLKEGKGLVVQAITGDGGEIELMKAEPYEDNNMIPNSVIRFVEHRGEHLVLRDAAVEGQYTVDPVIKAKNSKSILCLPIIHQGSFKGVLYLENTVASDVFTEERIELLKVLSGQIAVSISNSLLYENLEEKVRDRTAEIEEQKSIIEEKNHEITDSINYASHIQEAMLPPLDELKENFPDSFMIFRPRDIVSGDFYWFARVGSKFIVTVSDCTGHGVPGALMSMVGNELLNNAVHMRGLTSPDDILTDMSQNLRVSLKQVQTGNRDGMDMALVVYDMETRELEYAGAKNPMWVVANGEVEEYKGHIMPIGGPENETVFPKHKVTLPEGATFYLFSDGYQDQFGGAKGKKFKSTRLKKLLVEIADKPCQEQKEVMEDTINEWQGQRDQIDDIAFMGFKLP